MDQTENKNFSDNSSDSDKLIKIPQSYSDVL